MRTNLFLLILLQVWDGYATALGITLGGYSEANPLMAGLASTPMHLFLFKATLITLAICGLAWAESRAHVSQWVGNTLLCIYGILGVYHACALLLIAMM